MSSYAQLFKEKNEIKKLNNNKKNNDQQSQLLQQIYEQNKIYCKDSKIYRNENINLNYNDLQKWPERSPYEFTNKNIIVPEDYKVLSNDIKDLNKHRLKKIDDGYYFEDASQSLSKNKQIDQKNTPKVTIIFPDIQNNNNNVLNINKISSRTNDINIDNNDSSNNEIIYNFGYKKEDRLTPLKLDLIKDTIDIQEMEYQNKKKEDIIKKDAKQLSNNIKILGKVNKNNVDDINNSSKDNTESNSGKNKSPVPIMDEELNLTKKQMDIMGEEVNKIYKNYKKISKQKIFYLKHPYIKYKNNPDQNKIIYNNKYTPPFYVRNRNQNKILNSKRNNVIKIKIPLMVSSMINKSNNLYNNNYYSRRENKISSEKIMRRNFSQIIHNNGNNVIKQKFNLPVINDKFVNKKETINNKYEFHRKYD